MGWFKKIIMTLMIMLDNVVYSFVESLYELFIKISEAGLFSEATIQTFSNRIYVFLGLFMIFRISISLVQYITDPAKFSDKSVGGAKLLRNGAVCLVAIVAVPYCFEAAYKLQGIILKENTIGNLILGIKSTDSDDSISYAERGGKLMAFSTFQAFMQFNDELVSRSCINNPVVDEKFNTTACTQEVYNIAYDANVAVIDEKESVGPAKTITNIGGLYELAYKEQDFRLLANPDLAVLEVTSDGNTYTLMDYKWFVSTLAGGFLCFVLLSFCFDVAVRSVKLGFLQLIAPVPIMFYLDPGNGKKKFDAWLKQVASTYLDLFIRLASIYFAVFIISSIATDGIINVAGSSNEVTSPMVKVFIIFGALMFAKELPKLLSELLGTGKGGSFSLNPLKKVPGLGAVAGLGLGAAAGVGAAGLYKAAKAKEMFQQNLVNGNNRMQAFGNAIIGKEKGSFLNNAFGVNDYRGQGLVGFAKGLGHTGKTIWGISGSAALGIGKEGFFGGVGSIKDGYNAKNLSGIKNAVNKSVSNVSANRNRKNDYEQGFLDRKFDDIQRTAGIKNGFGTYGEANAKMKELSNNVEDYKSRENQARRAFQDQTDNISKMFNAKGVDTSKIFDTVNTQDGSIFTDETKNARSNALTEYKNKVSEEMNNKIDAINRDRDAAIAKAKNISGYSDRTSAMSQINLNYDSMITNTKVTYEEQIGSVDNIFTQVDTTLGNINKYNKNGLDAKKELSRYESISKGSSSKK